MAKVVTSQGIQDFVQAGKFEQIKNDPPKKKQTEAPPLEVKDKPVVADVSDDKKDDKEPKKPAHDAPDEDLDDDDDTRADMDKDEKLRDRIARKNATINRKHREMREAREAADEAERFAENQYQRATRAEARAEAQERELAEWRAKAAPLEKKEEKTKPDPKAFYDDKGQFKAFEYAEELAAYSANKAVADDRATQAEDKRKAEHAAAETQARERVAETSKKYPDFAEVMQACDLQTHNAVLQYLSASEHIGEVSYYLAKHPDFVERINKLNPLKAIAEIGKLELTFEKPPAKADEKSDATPAVKTSGAPAPIKPLSSATTVNTNTDPAKMSYKELRAYERSRNRRRS